jgi:hypothetical protein|tara:strand:+ start:2462 stop:2977 length:516 start_codon:yes stop_codon:yes gene_type:complete
MLLNGKNLKPEWFNDIQQMRNEEIEFLYKMVESTEGDILEIGMGGSTFAFLDATKDTDRKVYSIDLKDKLKDYYDYIPKDYLERLTFIQANSHEYNLEKVNFEMLLIDGDHTFTSVRRDSLSYWNNVVDNGLILYHDYNTPGVEKFVDSMVDLDMATLYDKQNNLVALKKS